MFASLVSIMHFIGQHPEDKLKIVRSQRGRLDEINMYQRSLTTPVLPMLSLHAALGSPSVGLIIMHHATASSICYSLLVSSLF